MKKIKRYLLILALTTTALYSGFGWLESTIEDAFITGASEGVTEAIKLEAEDRLTEKLFSILEENL